MKRKHLISVAVLITGGAALLIVQSRMLDGQPRTAAGQAVNPTQLSGIDQDGRKTKMSKNARTPVDPALRPDGHRFDPSLLSFGPKPIPASLFAEYLETRKTDPAAWGAVFDLSSDQALLRQALEKFPDDRSLLQRAALSLEPAGDRLMYIQKLNALFPDGSIGNYAEALAAFSRGDLSAAADKMREAATKSPPSLFGNGDILNRQAALRSTGMSEADVALHCFNVPSVTDNKNGLLGIIGALATSELPDGEKAELGLPYTVHLRQAGAKSAAEELQASAFEQAFLRNLPADAEYGDTGQSVGDRLKEVSQEVDSVFADLQGAQDLWDTATDQEIREWSDAALAGGELFAYRRWLEERKRKAQ